MLFRSAVVQWCGYSDTVLHSRANEIIKDVAAKNITPRLTLCRHNVRIRPSSPAIGSIESCLALRRTFFPLNLLSVNLLKHTNYFKDMLTCLCWVTVNFTFTLTDYPTKHTLLFPNFPLYVLFHYRIVDLWHTFIFHQAFFYISSSRVEYFFWGVLVI